MSGDQVPPDLAELAEHTSAREREAAEVEYRADDICLAWLLERQLFERGWDDPFEGEIIGVIDSIAFQTNILALNAAAISLAAFAFCRNSTVACSGSRSAAAK